MKPIAYLDVDDTLIPWPAPVAPEIVAPFFRWLSEHFEVRWLTMWCPSGHLSTEGDDTLAPALVAKLGLTIEEVLAVRNPHPFPVQFTFSYRQDYRSKHASIETMLKETPDREWVWIEDSNLERGELEFVAQHPDRFYPTEAANGTETFLALADALSARFHLPPFAP